MVKEKSSVMQLYSPPKKSVEQQLNNLGNATPGGTPQAPVETSMMSKSEKFAELYEDAR